jgi:hypothetical protein
MARAWRTSSSASGGTWQRQTWAWRTTAALSMINCPQRAVPSTDTRSYSAARWSSGSKMIVSANGSCRACVARAQRSMKSSGPWHTTASRAAPLSLVVNAHRAAARSIAIEQEQERVRVQARPAEAPHATIAPGAATKARCYRSERKHAAPRESGCVMGMDGL